MAACSRPRSSTRRSWRRDGARSANGCCYGALRGSPLSRTWPEMSENERRRAVAQLADALRALHSVVLPQEGPDAIKPPFLDRNTLECPHQLPPSRTLELVEQATGLRYVDSAMLAQRGRDRAHRGGRAQRR